MLLSLRELPVPALAERVVAGDRAALARAVTLVESRKPEHRIEAGRLLQILAPHTGQARRVGVTGVPGVGKSTTIDSLGSYLTALGRKVAVLAVDPSSSRTGGSILGDKTRMARLSVDANAFIRPSPSNCALGGVGARTRETMLVCEAAGFDVVLVETVGIGQSETMVADMTDFFLALMLPGAGDELQGIKKGVLELADMIAVNKSDGANRLRAETAAAEYRAALHILAPSSPLWSPPVILISGLQGEGLDVLWGLIEDHRAKTLASGDFDTKRRDQQAKWMWAMVEDRFRFKLRRDPKIQERLSSLEAEVAQGALSPTVAADEIATLVGL